MAAQEFGIRGSSPDFSTTAASVVVWMMRRLGLEVVIAFRGQRRYGMLIGFDPAH
jgi:hypothetical protein